MDQVPVRSATLIFTVNVTLTLRIGVHEKP